MKVKNITALPHYGCGCGTWLKHWEKFSAKKSAQCAVPDCNTVAAVGAHIQKANTDDEAWYVVPLCQTHSESVDEMEISAEYKLVPADTNLTCERW